MAEPSLFEKIKTGAKSFFKGALHYIPRGVLFVGALFGASALLGATISPGWDLLHVAEAANSGTLVSKFLISLGLGAAISGGIDTYKALSSPEIASAPATTAMLSQQQKGLGIAREPSIGFLDPVVPKAIPTKATETVAHTAAHFMH